MEEIIETFLLILSPMIRSQYYLEEVFDKGKEKEFHNTLKLYLKKSDNKNKRYYYLITFTLSDDNIVDSKLIKQYIISRLRGSALQIEKCHLVEELTQKGTPHWHASVISKKYISKDRFKYYVNKFGYIDISKNHSQNYDTMLKYITKSNTANQIIGG